MFPNSNSQNSDVNGMLSGIISGVVSTVLTGVLNHYVVKPVVQKGVDKIVPPEPLELTRTVEVEVIEVVEDEENDDTK